MNKGFAFGQHVETTGEREGDNRQAKVQRNLECSPFESSHFAVKGTCSLREDDGADATYELFLHLLEALQRRFGVAAVDEDMSGGLAPRADERHLAELRFHQPFEDHRQPSVDEPYVEHRLMVGDEDITLTGLYMLLPLYAHRQKHQPEERAGPELLHFVHKLRIAPVDGADSEDSGKNSKTA